jgi:hypothetical protein
MQIAEQYPNANKMVRIDLRRWIIVNPNARCSDLMESVNQVTELRDLVINNYVPARCEHLRSGSLKHKSNNSSVKLIGHIGILAARELETTFVQLHNQICIIQTKAHPIRAATKEGLNHLLRWISESCAVVSYYDGRAPRPIRDNTYIYTPS